MTYRAKVIVTEEDLREFLNLPENVTITFLEASSDPRHVKVGLQGQSLKYALERAGRVFRNGEAMGQQFNQESPLLPIYYVRDDAP